MFGARFLRRRHRLGGGGAPAFSPADLFQASETGGWWEVKLGSVWQDTAGTSAATTAGQSVARLDDLSGNGNHFLQASASLRPVLRQNGTTGKWYLEFNGSSHYMTTSSFFVAGIAATNGASAVASFKSRTVSGERTIFAEGNTAASNPVVNPVFLDNVARFTPRIRGDGGTFFVAPAGVTAVAGTHYLYSVSFGAANVSSWVNQTLDADNVSFTYAATTVNTASLGALVRNTIGIYADMDFYGLVARGKVLTTAERGDTEAYLATATGVSL